MSRSFAISEEKIISNCLHIKLRVLLLERKSRDHVILTILILNASDSGNQIESYNVP